MLGTHKAQQPTASKLTIAVLSLGQLKKMSDDSNSIPTLIALGGYPGSGKSTVSRRLSEYLGIPRFGSDFFKRAVLRSKEFLTDESKDSWIAFDILFDLAEDQLSRGVYVIIDTSFRSESQWKRLDSIAEKNAGVAVLPIVLRADYATCRQRIVARYKMRPDLYSSPEVFDDPKFDCMWSFFEQLDRTDIRNIDSRRRIDEVCDSVISLVLKEWALPNQADLAIRDTRSARPSDTTL